MIQLFNVSKTYGGVTPALNDVTFSVKKGEFIFLTGPSGAGKTTLLKILFRTEKFDRGQVLVHGMNIGKVPDRKLYTLRRQIGFVFQDYKLLERKSVFENVAFAQEVIGADRKRIRFKTWEALKNVGLTHKKDSYPPQLSGGEQQRVAVARALVNSPRIILADEPTGNLDPEISLEILKLFEHAKQRGVTVIFATHDQEMIRSRNHRVVIIKRGELVTS
ncbi:MAG: putative cell-division ATP-binding protein [Nitrospinaceae bacterium]|nr:MAG: putative cell-division ATP-binding protein [Nitrospinaceae bacterium]